MAAQSIKHPAPIFSHGVYGAVVLKVLVNQKGKVMQSTPMSGPAELSDAAKRAVAQWTFKPYLLNGMPMFVETTVTINFHQ